MNQKSTKDYSLRIPNQIHKRIQQHLAILQFLGDNNINQHQWILEAIKKKIANLKTNEDQKLDKEAQLSNSKSILIKIDHKVYEQLDKIVNQMKKIYGTFSKKQLILRAIFEHMETEKEIPEELIKHIKSEYVIAPEKKKDF